MTHPLYLATMKAVLTMILGVFATSAAFGATLDFNTSGQFLSAFTPDSTEAGGTKQTTTGGITGGSLVPALTYEGENTLKQNVKHTFGQPSEISIYFRFDQTKENPISIYETLISLRLETQTALAAHLELVATDEGFHLLNQTELATADLVHNHWYKASLSLTAHGDFGEYNATAVLEDCGATGTNSPLLIATVSEAMADRDITSEAEFIASFSSQRDGGVSNLDNFSYTSGSNTTTPPGTGSLVVYNVTSTGSAYGQQRIVRFKRGGYAVVDLDANLCTLITTFKSSSGKGYVEEIRDETTRFQCKTSRSAEFTVVTSVLNDATAPNTNVNFFCLKGKNTVLIPQSSLVFPKSLTGITRVMTSTDEYLEEANIIATINLKETISANSQNLNREQQVQNLKARLNSAGYAEY